MHIEWLIYSNGFLQYAAAAASSPHRPPPSMALARTPAFDENYVPAWGADGYHLVNQGRKIRLAMDKNSGAGFASKLSYGSGFFRMRIKVPGGYTAGVVTAFYVS
jgi:xyloglucan:xyloglucosyl transferase